MMTLGLLLHKSAVSFPHKPLFFSKAGCLYCKAVPFCSKSRFFFSSVFFFYVLFIQSTQVIVYFFGLNLLLFKFSGYYQQFFSSSQILRIFCSVDLMCKKLQIVFYFWNCIAKVTCSFQFFWSYDTVIFIFFHVLFPFLI